MNMGINDDPEKYERLKAIGQEVKGVDPNGEFYFGPIDQAKTFIVNKWEQTNAFANGLIIPILAFKEKDDGTTEHYQAGLFLPWGEVPPFVQMMQGMRTYAAREGHAMTATYETEIEVTGGTGNDVAG